MKFTEDDFYELSDALDFSYENIARVVNNLIQDRLNQSAAITLAYTDNGRIGCTSINPTHMGNLVNIRPIVLTSTKPQD